MLVKPAVGLRGALAGVGHGFTMSKWLPAPKMSRLPVVVCLASLLPRHRFLAGSIVKRRGRLEKWARGSLSLKQKTVPSRVCARRQPWEKRKTTRQESKNTHRATQTSRAQTLPIRKHAKQPVHGGIVSKATLCVSISNWPPCSTSMHNCGVYGPHACLSQQPRCIG